MTEFGTIQAIFRYPVKSMLGETLPEVTVGAGGIPGDRGWAVRDEVRGGIRGAKKIARLMTCTARYDGEPRPGVVPPALITLPSGETIRANEEHAAAKLSAAIDHQVTLWPLLPPDALEHYRRGAPDSEDFEQEMRAMFARNADEPLPDLAKFPPELLEYESPPGTYFDAFPLLLITQASLDHLQSTSPHARFDVRRFRPNFLIDAAAGQPSMPELSWTSARIRIGACEIRTTVDCPRCVMTTHPFADLPRDPSIMRTIVREAGGSVGVYATVTTPGTVRIGDAVTMLEPAGRL
jgi:hypothetical protein